MRLQALFLKKYFCEKTLTFIRKKRIINASEAKESEKNRKTERRIKNERAFN
nr:MAG TPA: hypothetical protein [Caudoviricetes sp.]